MWNRENVKKLIFIYERMIPPILLLCVANILFVELTE